MKRFVQTGFTLVELVSVIVVVGIITASLSFKPVSTSLELQASRDNIINLFKAAQNLAMTQNRIVQFRAQGSTVSVLIDTDNDSVPDSAASIFGESFPKTITGELTSTQLNFNKLGQTPSASFTLRKDASSVVINVSATGYVY